MEDQSRQPWTLIAIAALSVVLGGMALLVAFDAEDTSEEAAKSASVARVSARVTKLYARLGIAEKQTSGQEEALRSEGERALRRAAKVRTALSNRIAVLERQTAALTKSSRQDAALAKEVGKLESQAADLRGEVATLNQRVTKLTNRVNSLSANSAGGAAAP